MWDWLVQTVGFMWHWLVQNGDTISKLGPLVAAVSALIAAFGAAYVYFQYRRAQEWRKGDLAASLMERLVSDPELAFACQALDWGTGPIMVPERYRP
jgi:Zn-dependent protease with chaperone function